MLTPLASRIVCVCEAERRLALGLGAGDRARVVYNGIDRPPDAPVHPEIAALRAAGHPVIATVTLLRPGKGIETLLDALPAVLARPPATQLVIAGTGVDRDALEARARALGVLEAVRFLGFTESSATVLRGADVFVSASWAESFPYVILEAMTLGVPDRRDPRRRRRRGGAGRRVRPAGGAARPGVARGRRRLAPVRAAPGR